MATNRTVALWESAVDLTALANNQFRFCIAKSVIDSTGNLSYNMVWQSLGLAPRITVEWEVKYCLNWTLTVPSPNAKITMGGVWQDCAKGQSFDLDTTGLWVPSSASSQPKADYMNVGKNNYAYSGARGIHIIVGVRTPDGKALPIFVDTLELGLGMSSWYQPQEKVQWWYERGVSSSTMVSGARVHVEEYDMTSPRPSDGQYYVSTSYLYALGTWKTSADNAPSLMQTGVLGGATNHLGLAVAPGAGDWDLAHISEELQELILYLRELKGSKQQPLLGGGIIFRGIINWPMATSVAVMTTGLGYIFKSLMANRYTLKTHYKSGDTQYTIEFSPPSGQNTNGFMTNGSIPDQVEHDWDAAVAADGRDGAQSGGLTEN